MVTKSVSPGKKDRAIKMAMNNAADNSTANFQTPQRQGDPVNNKSSRRLHTTEANLNNMQTYAHQMALN